MVERFSLVLTALAQTLVRMPGDAVNSEQWVKASKQKVLSKYSILDVEIFIYYFTKTEVENLPPLDTLASMPLRTRVQLRAPARDKKRRVFCTPFLYGRISGPDDEKVRRSMFAEKESAGKTVANGVGWSVPVS